MKFTVNATLENPLRDIILNREELLKHAVEIARFHLQVGTTYKHRRVLPRFAENTKFLRQAHKEITNYVQKTKDIVPAAEWFLDNYYLLKDSRYEVSGSLPWRYERQLPRVAGGDFEGFPRIYALMVELVEHTDSELSSNVLIEFINDYQNHIPLTTGELWAIPSILKIILIENIRRLTEQVLRTQNEREAADHLISLILESSHQLVNNWSQILDGNNFRDTYTPEYAERLFQRIRELGVDGAAVLRWLERSVNKHGLTIEALAKLEHQRQAMCQVSMGHAISGMRYIAEEDWTGFFERTSIIEKSLGEDPSGIYSAMDFTSRDKYRQEVEKMARQYKVAESVIVRKVIFKAQEANAIPETHVGYYLIGSGRKSLEIDLENEWGKVKRLWCQIRRVVCGEPHSVYFGTLALSSFILLYAILQYAIGITTQTQVNFFTVIGLIFILFIPITSISVPLANWIITRIIPPAFLPKLELRKGIPSELRTIVVVPTLLTGKERVQEIVEQLEIYHLANQDPNLHFALLGDYKDSKEEEEASDSEIIRVAKLGIENLNKKYGSNTFFFLNRKRLWNNSEGKWMGWERKRGKLIEFNRLLMGLDTTTYTEKIGDLSLLPQMKYVITLDADTQLPRGVAKKLVGTMAHPLHAPMLNDEETRVIKGYGVLQPRIGISLQSASVSPFARIFSGQAGIDPYTAAVSDIYQDLFGEGIFTGKGIYDVKIFHKVTDHAFPENQILSHDLIEGIYARAGLVTDIELIDGYPAKYHAFIRRAHRWIRGDWQILKWIIKPLPLQSRWKIADNLRRSLEAPSLMLLIILGMTLLQNTWFWIVLAFAFLLGHSALGILSRFFVSNQADRPIEHELRDRAVQVLFQFVMLPYQAYVNLDAIVRSVYRQAISHRGMLEWETAADTDQRLNVSFLASLQAMWPVGLFIIVLGFVSYRLGTTLKTLPILAVWASSPWIAYSFSRSQPGHNPILKEEDRRDLRIWGRKIWSFFAQYVTAEENWLPPDNVQIDPPNGIAHRTSPTNIGLALLANLTAWDLGYSTLETLQKRTIGTLDTLDKLDKWNGHLYNWYDTLSLKPLHPLYISTVDSGNLAVYCITLENGLKNIEQTSVFGIRQVQGLMDTAHLLEKVYLSTDGKWLLEFKTDLNSLFANFDLLSWHDFLHKWLEHGIVKGLYNKASDELTFWATRLEEMILAFCNELELICPWLTENGFRQQFYARDSSQRLGYSLDELLNYYSEKERFSQESQLILQEARKHIESMLETSREIRQRLRLIAYGTDFKPLYDSERQLFSIGYRINDGVLDKSYYDLLASEARQASFMAIAKGDVPQSHWFRLGRSMTRAKGLKGLVSWSGTMFEFLMPLIIMKNYKSTLLDVTYQTVVEVQRRFGNEQKIPWGISESGFYAFDAHLNYQYKAFGVPGLGLKRGLIQDLVIAPYATFLALMVDSEKSVDNLRRMRDIGFEDRYGFFEAIDYTPERLPLNEDYRIVKSYMAHHQGMSFTILGNILFDNIMQKRFHEEPSVQATELLLQEKFLSAATVLPQPEEEFKTINKDANSNMQENRFISFHTPDTKIPTTHLVSNGDYSVMVSNSGSGYSRWKNIAVSRWREDVTRDSWGMYFYIQNLNSGSLWSATYQPCRKTGEDYEVTYSPDRVEFYRKDGNIVTRTEIFVSAEDHVEIRRISLTNQSQHDRIIEITSYFEVVLAPQSADSAHPAFSNLFIQTQFENHALLASRRPRSEEDPSRWLMHTVAIEGDGVGVVQYETDRARFIGRGRDLANPQALEPNQPLSNTVGAVLDPIMSLRQRVRIPSGKTVRVSFSVGVGNNRDEVMSLARKYRNSVTINRAYELAWTHSQMELRHLNLSPSLANEALSLAGHLLYLSPLRRENAEYIKRNVKGQSSLWPYAVSGDLPIIVLQVKESAHLNLVRQLVAIHEYWRFKGLSVDLIILNEDESGYVQAFHDMLRDIVAMGHARDLVNKPGGVFLLQRSHLPIDDLNLIFTVARAVFTGDGGTFSVQLRRKVKENLYEIDIRNKGSITDFAHVKKPNDFNKYLKTNNKMEHNLLMFNGIGGFSKDGKEYIIELKPGVKTPLPWLNVIANPEFGFQVTETGGGYTWSKNSRENKLTPWSNDPIIDCQGEVIYVKDLDTDNIWAPTPNPIRNNEAYTVRHGQGYTSFEHNSQGILHELLIFVPIDKPTKVSKLTLRNTTQSERKLQITYYVEWVLGVTREQSAPYIVTEFDKIAKVLKARNVFQEEFSGKTAFIAARGAEIASYSGDRSLFIGRNHDLKNPIGLLNRYLEQSVGAGLDPCGAIQLEVILKPNEDKEIFFYLGEVNTSEELDRLLLEYQTQETVNNAFDKVVSFWDNLLSTIQISTPDDSMNLLVNRWLLYQTLVCRLWARSGFYQSGGAYGFRDQLQDVMALVIANPSLTREQIIKHCAHQFIEGDVQHWWHHEKGKGIRTKFSDDLLWLPFVTLDYLEHTQDYTILDIEVSFIEDEPLGENEDERYSIPKLSNQSKSVYEHCIRAIERSLKYGEHGIPLIGTGDWNDGFSRIGRKGKGESIWLGWFQLIILKKFASLCESRGDHERANKYLDQASILNENMEKYAWDGGWYRRAYFDDGTPLGSNKNSECQIDALAQSWSVISGGATKSRAEDAMLALEHYLLKREDAMLLLLTPPFDKFEPDPGYIKGYVPGVRENGGQYTHGAIWSIIAFALMGEGEKAAEVFHILNPINHTRTEAEVARYKTEPYVMAADVYAKTPNVGRGGWTWYTGAAGWMYQAALEGILGFKLRGDSLEFSPCIPKEWDEYLINYRYQSTHYRIRVVNPNGKNSGVTNIQCDGNVVQEGYLKLINDGSMHEVTVLM